jgi:hypothetical protein
MMLRWLANATGAVLLALTIMLPLSAALHAQGTPQFLRGTPQIIAPVPLTTTFIVAEGDSITQNNATGVITYPIKFAPDTSLVTLIDTGHAGDQLAAVVAREASDTALFAANPGFKNYIYTVLIGVNNCCGFDPTTLAAGIGTLAATMKTNIQGVVAPGSNVYVVVSTLPDFSDGDATKEAWRTTLNAGIVTLVPSQADAVIDYGADPIMGPAGAAINVSLFFDQLHPTNLGQTYVERDYAVVVNSLIAGSVAPGAPTAPYANGIQQTAVTLTWTPPATGGYYSDFTIQYRTHGSGAAWSTFSHTASRAPTAYITGLVANTSYDFQVAATGMFGQSEFAALSGITTNATPYTNTFDTISAAALGVTFSNSNLTVNATAQGFAGLAKTFAGKSSGKWYFEFKITKSTAGVFTFGIIDGTAAQILPNWLDLGLIPNSAAAGAVTNQTGFNLVNVPGISPGLNDIIGIAFDATAKKVWVAVNNTYTASGNPGTGANPWETWSPTYTIYGAAEVSFNGDAVTYSGASPFYSPPSGFSILTPYLLKRDLYPASNDNSPVGINHAA